MVQTNQTKSITTQELGLEKGKKLLLLALKRLLTI
jgi:hypothetical protein